MSTSGSSAEDGLDFLRKMWGNMGFGLPGMVTPTLDVEELDKRIADLRAVEGWLKMNLGMLQMTIQGLDVQRATLSAMRAMSEAHSGTGDSAAANPFANPNLWTWPFAATGTAPDSTAATQQDDAQPAQQPPEEPPKKGGRGK